MEVIFSVPEPTRRSCQRLRRRGRRGLCIGRTGRRHPGNVQDCETRQARTLRIRRTLHAIARSIESGRRAGSSADVRRSCAEFLYFTSAFYKVPSCGLRVLAARPLRVRENWASELFGDYHPETMLIRIWMRTAVRKEITSFGTFLSTLCHEFCHHLDFQRFRFPDSWHTRGFYERTATLYHYSRDTARRRLFWAPVSGGRWRIDWPRTNRGV